MFESPEYNAAVSHPCHGSGPAAPSPSAVRSAHAPAPAMATAPAKRHIVNALGALPRCNNASKPTAASITTNRVAG